MADRTCFDNECNAPEHLTILQMLPMLVRADVEKPLCNLHCIFLTHGRTIRKQGCDLPKKLRSEYFYFSNGML